MLPVAMMLGLVCLLGLTAAYTRSRVQSAREAANAAQLVRIQFIEVRSISRSLQRDALNLLLENDKQQLDVIHAKFADRSKQMRFELREIIDNNAAGLAATSPYAQSQFVVLDRLAQVATAATKKQQTLAWGKFRSEVRPNERMASRIADKLIARQEALVTNMFQRARQLESQEAEISLIASCLLFGLAGGLTALIAQRTILRPLLDIERSMETIAAGNAEGRTPHGQRRDEIGRMSRAIEVFRSAVLAREGLEAESAKRRLAELERERHLEDIRRATEQAEAERSRSIGFAAASLEAEVASIAANLRGSASKLSGSSLDLAKHSEVATMELGDVEVSVHRAIEGANHIAAAATQFMEALSNSNESTRLTAALSARAAEQAVELSRQMDSVEGSARVVGSVVELISGIAKRTNVLAINATIEAARVGEAGKGFSVVADEVRALATQTAQATLQITDQIDSMQRGTKSACLDLTVIQKMIDEMAGRAKALSNSISEQAQSGQSIRHSVTAAAKDLNLIGSLVTGVSAATKQTEDIATMVKSDSSLVEESALAIDESLKRFFGKLKAA